MGDGLPENEGFPDQTYDVWTMKGESAYCGSLYLAALRAAEEMAKKLGDPQAAQEYHAMFEKGQKSFIQKLWNGSYFRYDTGSEYRENVMADQLVGQWYANLTGLGDIVPRPMRQSALRKIYDLNVMKFAGGEIGAVNGIAPDGNLLTGNEQVEEVWAGTAFGLASLMLSEGLREEGYRTAWGVYHVVYERYGFWFRTPEAWNSKGEFRASMYMRPGAIWAMEWSRRRPQSEPRGQAVLGEWSGIESSYARAHTAVCGGSILFPAAGANGSWGAGWSGPDARHP